MKYLNELGEYEVHKIKKMWWHAEVTSVTEVVRVEIAYDYDFEGVSLKRKVKEHLEKLGYKFDPKFQEASNSVCIMFQNFEEFLKFKNEDWIPLMNDLKK